MGVSQTDGRIPRAVQISHAEVPEMFLFFPYRCRFSPGKTFVIFRGFVAISYNANLVNSSSQLLKADLLTFWFSRFGFPFLVMVPKGDHLLSKTGLRFFSLLAGNRWRIRAGVLSKHSDELFRGACGKLVLIPLIRTLPFA